MGDILPDRGDLDHLVRVDLHREGAPVLQLEVLGDVGRDPEHDPEIAGDRLAAHRDGRRVHDRAGLEDREVRRVPADVQEGHPELPVLVREDGFRGGQWREHELIDLDAGPLDALGEILHARLRRGHDVGLDLEAHRAHADRVADALLAVDDVPARDHMQDLPGVRDRDGARRLDRAKGVLAGDVAVMPGDGDHAA